MEKIKIIFMGTPEFSVPVLDGLNQNYDVIGVVTQPDRKVGRKGILTYSPVKEYAINNNIKVFQPIKIKKEYDEILAMNPDVIITCAYGQIIPKIILDFPKYGCINVHASLLPKLRGGAPIHHAIIDGEEETGITIMYMDELMDNGDIITQEKIKIEDYFTTEILHDKLSIMGKNLLLRTLPDIINGNINRTKQDNSKVTFGYNITPDDEKINFNKTTREVYNQIRGLNSWPIGYTTYDSKRMKIYESVMSNNEFKNAVCGEITGLYKNGIGVKTKDAEIILTLIQLEGKNKMNAVDFINGISSKEAIVGKKLGD